MSEDRNNGIGDPAVSDTYRDVATERAPASLNEAVLRNAAAHASKGYAHSMLWIRPLAYAATVVLSLGIVVCRSVARRKYRSADGERLSGSGRNRACGGR